MPPRDDLYGVMRMALPKLPERSVLVITSKIVSIGEGRCIPKEHYPDKDVLIKKEADKYLPREETPGTWVMHTLKRNIFIPSAGIDESNSGAYYTLWPKDPQASAQKIWKMLRRAYRIKNLGIVISDSHSVPLRRGMMGFALSYYGFQPLKEYRGTNDLFGREMKMTQRNFPDALATAAVMAMGEGNESMPLALIRDIPDITFGTRTPKSRFPHSSFEIKTREDLYYPFLSAVRWKKGGGGIEYPYETRKIPSLRRTMPSRSTTA